MKKLLFFLVGLILNTHNLLAVPLTGCRDVTHQNGIPAGPYQQNCCNCKFENNILSCQSCQGDRLKYNPSLTVNKSNSGEIAVNSEGNLEYRPSTNSIFSTYSPHKKSSAKGRSFRRNLLK